jgi:hypothetical protein
MTELLVAMGLIAGVVAAHEIGFWLGLGRLGCRRCPHLAPSAFETETLPAFRKMRGIHGASLGEDMFLTVAIMSVTFLTEVGLFILIGML